MYAKSKRTIPFHCITVLLIIAEYLNPGYVTAGDFHWFYNRDRLFINIDTWSTRFDTFQFGGLPSATDRAIYRAGGRVDFTGANGARTGSVVVLQGPTTFDLQGATYITDYATVPGNLNVINAGGSGAFRVNGTLEIESDQFYGDQGKNLTIASGGRVRAYQVSLNGDGGVGGETLEIFEGELIVNGPDSNFDGVLRVGTTNNVGLSQVNLHSSNSRLTARAVTLGNNNQSTASAELNVLGGELDVSGGVYMNRNARLQIAGNTSVNVGTLSSNLINSTNNQIILYNGAVVQVTNAANLGPNTQLDLSNAVFDTGTLTAAGTASAVGHGIIVGNSAGLTVASPDGAVDTSYDMNIGSRRADIFSNSNATLRGDVSLSGGGILNATNGIHLVGSEFSQAASGGVTTLGGDFLIDNSVATIAGGNVNVNGRVKIGESNGSSTLNHSGGTITASNHVVVGSSLPAVYNNTGGHLTTTGTGELIVGDASGWSGTVNQNGGVVNVQSLTLANKVGADATYNLQSGTLNTRDRVLVGWMDAATYAQDGGEVNTGFQFWVDNGSQATVNDGTINATDSIRVGVTAGTSSSMIQNGGLVKTDEYFVIGSNGSGTYELTGGTLEAKGVNRGLAVGSTGASVSASMTQSGGHVDVGELVVGHTSGGTNSYTISNGKIDARDRIVVGNHVAGTFTQTGGRVDSLNATIIVGNTAGADGSHYQVDGGLTETSGLWVGNYGDATFTQTGGYVDANSVVVAREASSTASYSLQGGRLWSPGTVRFGDGNGSFELDGGTLDVDVLDATGGSFTFTSGTLEANEIRGMDLAMSDGLLDVGTLNGDLNMMGGTLAPGNSPGLTTINGDYLISGGLLDMELAGLAPVTEHDFLDVNGDWTITGGDLQITLLGGFLPMAGNSFDLFDFNSLTGTFDNIFLPTLGSGLTWNTSALYSTGTLSVNAATVPEPSTWALMATVCGAGVWRQRRKRRGSVSSSSSR